MKHISIQKIASMKNRECFPLKDTVTTAVRKNYACNINDKKT